MKVLPIGSLMILRLIIDDASADNLVKVVFAKSFYCKLL